jgi:hypothetical protein
VSDLMPPLLLTQHPHRPLTGRTLRDQVAQETIYGTGDGSLAVRPPPRRSFIDTKQTCCRDLVEPKPLNGFTVFFRRHHPCKLGPMAL